MALVTFVIAAKELVPGKVNKDRLTGFVRQIRGEGKWIVGTLAMTIEAEKSESYRWWKFYFGETAVRARVDGCQFQYLIQASQVSTDDFRYDKGAHTLTAVLPKPQIDEEVVDIPSSPSRWWVFKESAWARFNKDEVETQLREELRTIALAMAKNNAWDNQVDQVVKEHLRKTIRTFFKDEKLKVELTWR
jgi:hypothetical protein